MKHSLLKALMMLQAPEADAGSGGGGNGTGTAPTGNGDGGTKQDAGAKAAPANKDGTECGAKKDSDTGTPDATAKGEGDKSKAGAKSDELDIKLPEGVTADESVLKQFRTLAKEVGLDSDKASKLAAFHVAQQQALVQLVNDEWKAKQDGWLKELKADPEFGKNYEASVEEARKAIVRFGGDDLAKALTELGVDNHPGLVRAFRAIGKAIAEDSSRVVSKEGGKKPMNAQERAAHFYKSATKPK